MAAAKVRTVPNMNQSHVVCAESGNKRPHGPEASRQNFGQGFFINGHGCHHLSKVVLFRVGQILHQLAQDSRNLISAKLRFLLSLTLPSSAAQSPQIMESSPYTVTPDFLFGM